MRSNNDSDQNQEKLDKFDQRLSKAQKVQDEKRPKEQANNAAGMAYRMAMELVVAVAVSGYIGHWLDQYFETKPWLMLVMILFGMAAGFKNVLRTASRMTTTAANKDSKEEK